MMIPKVIDALDTRNTTAMIVGGGSVVFLFAMKFIKICFDKTKWLKLVPEILIVVVVTILVTWTLGLDDKDGPALTVLGDTSDLSGSLPIPHFSNSPFAEMNPDAGFPVIMQLVGPAIIISIVGFVEAMVLSKEYANEFNYQVSPNRELVAFGIGNVVGSFFQIFPSFTSMPRTVINVVAGARTQIATLICAILIGFSFYCLPAFYYLPSCVMTAIIFVAAIGLFEARDLVFMIKSRSWVELMLFATTFLLTSVLSIEIGLAVSFLISILRVVSKTSKPRMVMLGKARTLIEIQRHEHGDESGGPSLAASGEFEGDSAHMLSASLSGDGKRVKYRNILDDDTKPLRGVLLCQVREPLHFANIKFIQDRLVRIENLGHIKAHPGEELRMKQTLYGVILDMRHVASIDTSALQTLLEMHHDYARRNIQLCFTKLTPFVHEQSLSCNFEEKIGWQRLFDSNHDAMSYVTSLMPENQFVKAVSEAPLSDSTGQRIATHEHDVYRSYRGGQGGGADSRSIGNVSINMVEDESTKETNTLVDIYS
eukprot:TRINITY_DN228_c0_g2_i3.p1 TRINITY_DN228_c0_g2~~TRINITY_DN228_c0_g2_i3.p1  ORF type:complete len:539 (+),score=89.74 TRINITY_DN228_c0_g2_i3:727-2343(+)